MKFPYEPVRLVVGRWFLVPGDWCLVLGYWLLVTCTLEMPRDELHLLEATFPDRRFEAVQRVVFGVTRYHRIALNPNLKP